MPLVFLKLWNSALPCGVVTGRGFLEGVEGIGLRTSFVLHNLVYFFPCCFPMLSNAFLQCCSQQC